MILGAEVCSQIFLEGVLRGPEGTPLAQSTQLGWILSGCIFSSHKSNTNMQETNKGHPVCLHSATISEVNDQLRAFWELEEVEPIQSYTQEEAQCDQFIDRTCRRNDSGRYIVKLPLCKDSMMLGESKKAAVRRLLSIERKFHQDDTFKQRYNGFMQEYFSLGHMEQVTKNESKSPIGICYIPHHGILKESSSSTKLRVVFDASHKTESGVSLNDIMSTGPKLQQDLSEIILRWRTHAIAFTADIEKMYRQILVDCQDTDLQRIVWRFSESSNIEEYRLLTVTYGTKSAPYLALKILKRLAQDEHKNFPVGAQILERDFFVDDVLSGSHDLQTALEIQTQLISILQSGGFHLRKWISNSPDLLTHLPSEAREISIPFNLSRDNSFKALGVYWSPILDQINIKVQLLPAIDIPTKRSLLSDAAKLYDPLGWISPTIIVAKIMFQRLWLLGLNWDDPLPADMAKDWLRYREDLYILETFEIPRWIGLKENFRAFELHGFSDASTSAYAAVVYSRIINVNGEVRVHLITGKTKVAPIRQISVPRLELCGAVLLAKLLRKCKRALFAEDVSLHAWTDSSVVLSWLKGHPNRWKTFIANRVSEIQGILSFDQWHHIPTTLNPADCASRGIQPSELRHHTLWWYGPDFLQVDPLHLPTTPNYNTSGIDLEERINQISLHQTQAETWSLLDKYSSLSKLIRVTATCHRFVNNLKISRHNTLQVNRCNNLQVQRDDRQIGVLTTEELTKAINSLILFVQGEMFRSELMDLEANKPINSKSRLLPLNPFIDDKGHLRVGGRLEYSLLTYQEKHPIILPPNNNLSSLIIHNAHLSTLHGGPQLTLSHIRNKYWIIKGRNLVRKHIQRCVVCIRNRPKLLSQIMASLPRQRVTLLRPFVHSGVDYAGPINIKTSKLRTSKITKGYICLFICLATRAVHIEFVSDLTTEAFVAAFRRFSARRGHCVELWSDRGTNFVGANAELTRKFHEICSKNSILTEILANDGTKWNFIPPGSPHFGGIWESGIKSVKHHLRRVISDRPLTYEEMCTLLTQIEACLNSRPICPLSECADDLKALTPAHLLIGTSMKLVPEENLLEVNINRLTRWKQVQQILQHFWKRWSKDYLHTLQQRRKWKHPQTDVKVNDVVLVKDENLPPAKWLLGKVEAVHPGRDGRVRVVTVKTKGSLLTRPVVKICVLPITDPDAEYECKKDKPT